MLGRIPNFLQAHAPSDPTRVTFTRDQVERILNQACYERVTDADVTAAHAIVGAKKCTQATGRGPIGGKL